MTDPYKFGTKSKETEKLQDRLIGHGLLEGNPDGVYGRNTRDAVAALQSQLGIVATGQPDIAVLRYLNLLPAAKPSLFDLLNLVPLLKGKPMTSDQITGILRLLLGIASGFFVAKGVGSPELWTWITAGALAAVPGVWTWVNNRPKVIVPLGKK